MDGQAPAAYTYDADGLLTGAGSLTLTRDPQTRLITGSTLAASRYQRAKTRVRSLLLAGQVTNTEDLTPFLRVRSGALAAQQHPCHPLILTGPQNGGESISYRS